jgi:hypothetical protein
VGSEAFFSTTRGFYRYDIVRDDLKKVAKWGTYRWSPYPSGSFFIAGGQVLYGVHSWNQQSNPELRIMNTDGSGKRLLVGGGPDGLPLWPGYSSFLLSPDGKMAVYFTDQSDETVPGSRPDPRMVSIRTDGTGLKKLPPFDPAQAVTGGYTWMRAWLEPSNTLLLMVRSERSPWSLLTYNLATGAQARLFETPRAGSFTISPSGDKVFIAHQPEVGGPTDVILLDIASSEFTPVMKVENPGGSTWGSVRRPVWNRKGDKVAFLVQQDGGVFSPAVYLLKERRVVTLNNVRVRERLNSTPPLGWTSGDAKLVLAIPEERSLKILDPGLAVERAVPVPASIG